MNFAPQKKGLTLSELLTATVLVSVILLGVMGFSLTLQRFQSTQQRSSILRIRADSVFADMSRNVYRAIGSKLDKGLQVFPPSKLTVRVDRNPTPTPTYADDTWITYWFTNDHRLLRCIPSDNTGVCNLATAEVLLDNVEAYNIVQQQNAVSVTITLVYDMSPGYVVDIMKNPRYTSSGGFSCVLSSF
ncbi:MAG: hypothetical protein HQL26_01625 [Candidatus Omnitrophica bacterium]|nr:hypothetical protein [Candidatus Omnitrophota bacterium]